MSEIRVNNIIADNGLDAVNFAKGINVSSGIITATSFSGSGANLTALPAANITGTLPAISGANLTGISAGITQADEWRVTANFTTANANMITSNWARNNNRFDKIGTGMSVDGNGHFTFPETGIYKIEFNIMAGTSNQQVRYVVGEIIGTHNNFSSEGSLAFGNQSISNDASVEVTAHCSTMFDVSDTSNHKVKFTCYSEHSITWFGTAANAQNRTYATFIRLGDT